MDVLATISTNIRSVMTRHAWTADHTLFKCDRWWRLRRELEVIIGTDMEPDTVMLQNAGNWKAVKEYTGMVLSTKEEEERRIQRGRAAAVRI